MGFVRARAIRVISRGSVWIVGSACLLPVFTSPGAGAQQSASYRDTVLTIQQHIQGNDLDGARALISAALKQYPATGGFENLLGVVEIQQGNTAGAQQAFSQAIKHSPKLLSAYLNLARVYMESAGAGPGASERVEALALYEKVEQLDPHNAEAAYQEATLLMWDGHYQRSFEQLKKLAPEAHSELRVQSIFCADEVALGHKEEAARTAASMAANPDLAEQDVLSVLPALRMAHRADLIDALYSAAGERQPLSASGLRVLGLAQEAEGKRDEARATLERVFAMDATSTAPLVDLARIAIADKDYQGALGYLAHARDLKPNDAELAYEFGVVCMKMKLLGEALKAMGEAIKLAPENANYNFGLGTLTAFAQDPSQALPYLAKYHQLRPADAAGTLAMGAAYYQANNYAAALPYLEKAVEVPSTAASAHYYLGSILRHQGRYDAAIRQLAESVALKPDQPDAYAELGQVYMQMQKYPEAEKQLNHAIALDAKCYAANFTLLKLYARTDDPRREEQSKRFETIRDKNEEQYTEAMRVIEVRPQGLPE